LTQLVQVVEPLDALNVPRLHCWQYEDPDVELKAPGGQGEQREAPPELNVPPGQGEQEVAPEIELKLPALQGLQGSLPVALKKPGVQGAA